MESEILSPKGIVSCVFLFDWIGEEQTDLEIRESRIVGTKGDIMNDSSSEDQLFTH
jgi:hypothetical protein